MLKVDGQLNALMLPSEESEDFAWTAWDGLPEARALDGRPASEHSLNIRWGRSALELLEEGEELSLCRHLETGRPARVVHHLAGRHRAVGQPDLVQGHLDDFPLENRLTAHHFFT